MTLFVLYQYLKKEHEELACITFFTKCSLQTLTSSHMLVKNISQEVLGIAHAS